MTLLNKVQFVCLDCEMTGLDPKKDRVIEAAAVQFTLSTTLDQYETLIDPQCPIPEESQAIHQITPAMLEGKPKIVEILPDFLAFVGKAPIVGHVVSFDIDMLSREAERVNIPCKLKENPYIDTLRLARHYGDSPNNSLKNLAHHFNIPQENVHRAMGDVRMNIGVFKHLIGRFKTLEQIFELLSRPIKMKYIPLGKYKGRLFSEIPLPYLQWAVQLDFDQDLIHSIRVELRRRKKGDRFSEAINPFTEL